MPEVLQHTRHSRGRELSGTRVWGLQTSVQPGPLHPSTTHLASDPTAAAQAGRPLQLLPAGSRVHGRRALVPIRASAAVDLQPQKSQFATLLQIRKVPELQNVKNHVAIICSTHARCSRGPVWLSRI